MARGFNKVMLIGNLGADPDTRFIPSGSCVTNFNIAVTDGYLDKNTGELKEVTEWVTVEVWGRIAETCAEYLRKGSQVFVEGKIKTDSWEDKDTGQKRYRTKVLGTMVQFLSSASRGDGNRNQRASDARDQDGMPPHGSAPSPQQEFDDDIPF